MTGSLKLTYHSKITKCLIYVAVILGQPASRLRLDSCNLLAFMNLWEVESRMAGNWVSKD